MKLCENAWGDREVLGVDCSLSTSRQLHSVAHIDLIKQQPAKSFRVPRMGAHQLGPCTALHLDEPLDTLHAYACIRHLT